MSAWKHPATIIASLALFVALGGGTALAGGLSGLISGKKIVNHSIGEEKLTTGAIRALRSHVYIASGAGVGTKINGFSTIVGKPLTLPAGSYLVFGRARVSTPSGEGARCRLDYGRDGEIDVTENGLQGSGFKLATLSMHGPLETYARTTVKLECASFQGDGTAGDTEIAAIKVGSVTES